MFFFKIKRYPKKLTYFISLFIIALSFTKDISYPIPLTRKVKQTDSPIFAKKSFVSEALERSGAAVVTIDTQRKVRNKQRYLIPPSLLIDPYLQKFLDLPNINSSQWRIERVQGSGVIFSSAGLVLTNAHVVEKTDKLVVGLSDGRRVSGRVVGEDSLTDLAVIRLDSVGPWPKATLGNSDEIKVGDWAIAVGNPYGLEKTVTLGIISNLNRNVSQLGIANKRLNLIQTDAAINPGNSGGPLLNADGEVIGINTLIHSGPGAGIGFAIPINQAINIANQLALNGKAIHAIIGVSLSYPNLYEKKLNKKILKGALINYVLPNSPAAIKGLKSEDIIIAIDEKEIKSPRDVVIAINNNGIDNEMEFTILRNNKKFKTFIMPKDISEFEQY